MGRLSRNACYLKYSKTLHHVGSFRVVKKRKGNGELRMIIERPWWMVDDNPREWTTLTDSHVKDVFVWLGRYLALKGKLPRNLSLEEIAVGAQRTAKAIREVNAVEILLTEVGDSGLRLEEGER